MYDELDILKEVTNIASCHGSTALSDFLKSKVIINPPAADIISAKNLPKNINVKNIGIAVLSKLHLGLEGEIIFILDEKNAYKLADIAYNLVHDQDKLFTDTNRLSLFTELGISVMREIGHTVIGAFSNALSITLKRIIILPLPSLLHGSVTSLFDFIFSRYPEDNTQYFIQCIFEVPKAKIKGDLCLILPPDSVKDIQKSCKNMLQE